MELQEFNADDFLSTLPSQNWLAAGNTLYQYKGFWFHPPFLLATKNVLREFKPLSTDVILASFPKTGTTWLKSLLFAIIYRSSEEPLTSKNPHLLIPNLETQLYFPDAVNLDYASISSSSNATSGSSSRIFSTHLPYQIFASTLNSSACKIVYMTREPKDTLISYWQFVNRSGTSEEKLWPLDIAVDQFCKGTLPFGPYYDHVLGYWKESQERPQKVFFITYEELKDDPKTHLKRLAEFLGCPLSEGDKNANEKELEDILRICSFEALSNLEVNKKSSEVVSNFMLPNNSFFRKGLVGDHMNFLKPEMIQRIDEITKEKFHGTGLPYKI